MIQLVRPTLSLHDSWLAGHDEDLADRPGADGSVALPAGEGFAGIIVTRAELGTPEGLARLVTWWLDDEHPGHPRPAGWVPTTYLWGVEDGSFVGGMNVRHILTDGLLEVGGHIGYGVRRGARGHGVATAMLRRVLPIARGVGIDPVLVTCDLDNVASRRTIERNGGVLEDVRGDKRRYWISTVPTTSTQPDPAEGHA